MKVTELKPYPNNPRTHGNGEGLDKSILKYGDLSGVVFYPVQGFENYEITINGKIRSIDRIIITKAGKSLPKPGIILKTPIDRYGYKKIVLCLEGKKNYFTVHRLVALTFVNNPHSKPQVNHKDGNKLNNHISNLEWCTSLENEQHAWKTGLKTHSHMKTCGPQKLNLELAQEIRTKKKNGMKTLQLSLDYSVSKSAIERCLRMETYKPELVS